MSEKQLDPKIGKSAGVPESHKVALEFAQSLINGDFVKAYLFMSEELKSEYPPKILKKDFEELSQLVEGKIKEARIGENSTKWDDWYNQRQKEDSWIYVWMIGDQSSEAISIGVDKDKNGIFKINKLKWGRE